MMRSMNSHNNPLQDVNLDNYSRAIQFFVAEDERERVWERRVLILYKNVGVLTLKLVTKLVFLAYFLQARATKC